MPIPLAIFIITRFQRKYLYHHPNIWFGQQSQCYFINQNSTFFDFVNLHDCKPNKFVHADQNDSRVLDIGERLGWITFFGAKCCRGWDSRAMALITTDTFKVCLGLLDSQILQENVTSSPFVLLYLLVAGSCHRHISVNLERFQILWEWVWQLRTWECFNVIGSNTVSRWSWLLDGIFGLSHSSGYSNLFFIFFVLPFGRCAE